MCLNKVILVILVTGSPGKKDQAGYHQENGGVSGNHDIKEKAVTGPSQIASRPILIL